LQYSSDLTTKIRKEAHRERKLNLPAPNGANYSASHIFANMKVFLNPTVAALPQHNSLFPELGCYGGRNENKQMIHRECGTGKNGAMETPLAPEFFPIKLTPEMDTE
jgi:hypothetical protein